MRALMVDSPHDPLAWRAEHEYRLGSDILGATHPFRETQRRPVYLPEGEWADWWTGAVHCGPTLLDAAPPLERIPLYARRDALIPTIAPADRIADGPWPPLTLLSFGGGDATCEVRDNNGITHITAHRWLLAHGRGRWPRGGRHRRLPGARGRRPAGLGEDRASTKRRMMTRRRALVDRDHRAGEDLTAPKTSSGLRQPAATRSERRRKAGPSRSFGDLAWLA